MSISQNDAKTEPYPLKALAPTERTRRKILKCPHTDRKHYAKNMCHNCYHRRGKTKKAFACEHKDKSHYSNGMCQNCYLAKYYLKRKTKADEKEDMSGQSPTSIKSLSATNKKQKIE